MKSFMSTNTSMGQKNKRKPQGHISYEGHQSRFQGPDWIHQDPTRDARLLQIRQERRHEGDESIREHEIMTKVVEPKSDDNLLARRERVFQ